MILLDITTFFGRFHPLIVHLPIGLLMLVFVLEVITFKGKRQKLTSVISFILFLATASAGGAVVLGYLLSLDGGYNEDTIFWHQWLGIALAIISGLAYFLRKRIDRGNKALTLPYRIGLFILFGLLNATGHLGGNLTHGSTYLTQHAPKPLKIILGIKEIERVIRPVINSLDSAIVFYDVILPIFDAKCIGCHNMDKMKGELILLDSASIMAGGKGGPIVELGNAEKSELYRRVSIPEHEKDFMPPEGKTSLTSEERKLLAWWINTEAPFSGNLQPDELDEEVKSLLLAYLGLKEGGAKSIQFNAPPAETSIILKIKKAGFSVRPIMQQNSMLDVSLPRGEKKASQEVLKLLLEIKDQITWLSLDNAGLCDADIDMISQFPHLTKLIISNNPISDVGLKKLALLEHLLVLNVYGTQISDTSVDVISGLPKLKKVYLWQTEITPEKIEKLKQINTQLEVISGIPL